MSVSKIVPLTNVGLLASAIERAMMRPQGLPGLVVKYGPSGLGKSVAAAWAANQHRAYYVECRDTWTKMAFLKAVLREMAITPSRTLSEMVDQVAEQLSRSGRPLIVDDVQYLLDKSAAMLLTNDKLADDTPNPFKGTAELVVDGRIQSDTEWHLLDTTKPVKPFVYQPRKKPVFVSQTNPEAEDVYNLKKYKFGAEARAAAGYGFWQLAFGSTGTGA